MKRCTSCIKNLPLSEFYFHSKRGRYFTKCKNCLKIYSENRRNSNSERVRRISRDSYYRNHEKNLLKKRSRSKDVRSAQGSTYYQKNKDKILAKNKEWRKSNKELSRAYWRNYKSRKVSGGESVRVEEWQKAVSFYGNRCLRCGSIEITQDHVVPLSKGGKHSISNLQPLCQSCNSWKNTKIIDFRTRIYCS